MTDFTGINRGPMIDPTCLMPARDPYWRQVYPDQPPAAVAGSITGRCTRINRWQVWQGQSPAGVTGSVRDYPLKHGHLVVCIKYPERNPGFKNFNGFKMRAFNEFFERQMMDG